MKMNDKNGRIKLSTGAEVNVMPTRVFSQIVNTDDIEQSNVKLKGYGGSGIPVIGESFIRCAYNNIYKDVKFDIVESSSKTALGLESCQDFKLIKIMEEIKHSSSGKVQGDADSKKLEAKTRSIKGLSDKGLKKKIEGMYPEIFNGLGKLTEKHQIHIKENATPVIHPPRKISLALLDRFKKELDTMERNSVIKRTEEPTDWVNSLVLVGKPDGSLRICLNPRDLNKAIEREHYQLPTFDEIASRLTGAIRLTKLDANKDYWQITLDEQSPKLTTNTPYGRYCFLQLPYGLHSAQEVFHKRISQEFEAMDGIETDID